MRPQLEATEHNRYGIEEQAQMIHVYGQGKPGDLGRPIFHHAEGIRDVALAILAGLWVHETHTNPKRHHEMHFGKGANGVNLYLDTGARFAFRGHPTADGDYDRVLLHEGSIRPLGPVVFTLSTPQDTANLWDLLSAALRETSDAAAA